VPNNDAHYLTIYIRGMSGTDTFDDIESDSDSDDGGDFISMGSDALGRANWKIAFLMFLIGIFALSDVFIEGVLTKSNDAEVDGIPTSKGTMIQLAFLSVAYILVDLLVGGEYL